MQQPRRHRFESTHLFYMKLFQNALTCALSSKT